MSRRGLSHALPIALLALAIAPSCRAHRVGISRGDYRLEGADVRVELSFARAELGDALPEVDVRHSGLVCPGSFGAATPSERSMAIMTCAKS